MQESRAEVTEQLGKPNLVFITVGMGGGTGTGAAPIIAEIAKDSGALTVAIVTKPFRFEGRKRIERAEEGLVELKMESPGTDCERTRSTLVAPLSRVSKGKVTRRSTSSGARPWDSVMIVTMGRLMSGSTSTGRLTMT